MIFYLLLIAFAALIQTTLTGINLCLLIVLSAALLRRDAVPLYIGFIGGLWLGLLSSANIGFYPLLFLAVTQLARLFRLLPISTHALFIFPLVVVISMLSKFATGIFLGQTINWSNLPIQVVIFYLIYYFAAFFEDRFFGRTDLRLKLR